MRLLTPLRLCNCTYTKKRVYFIVGCVAFQCDGIDSKTSILFVYLRLMVIRENKREFKIGMRRTFKRMYSNHKFSRRTPPSQHTSTLPRVLRFLLFISNMNETKPNINMKLWTVVVTVRRYSILCRPMYEWLIEICFRKQTFHTWEATNAKTTQHRFISPLGKSGRSLIFRSQNRDRNHNS